MTHKLKSKVSSVKLGMAYKSHLKIGNLIKSDEKLKPKTFCS